jgi:peroxiredoxin
MNRPSSNWSIVCLVALVLGAGSAGGEEPSVQASIQPARDRKQAPAFALEDAAGKKVQLSDFRGKVMLLDFWATECGGCVKEIPWFVDLAQAYKNKGFTVAGVSLDVLYESLKDADEGWSRVKPFVQAHKVTYPILMGDDQVTTRYDIHTLPVTYLIDKRGRIAATYRGLVDKDNLEANIQTVLKEPNK